MKVTTDAGGCVPVLQKSSHPIACPVPFFSSFRAPGNVLLSCALLFGLQVVAAAQTTAPEWLTLDRIFSREFDLERLGGFRWLKTGDSFAKLEPSATVAGAMDLVSYHIETNRRAVLIPAEKLIPKGEKVPLSIQDYAWTEDGRRVLIYTNSRRVWRLNTRGDYWVLDAASGGLTKLGGEAKPSTLMFAKFSPDGKRVGYVRGNDLYVEDLAEGKITRLTSDGSHTLINGTSDWVNEEEFELRDCWRWSPDGRSVAFWQFNAEGIEDFILVNNTNGLYPTLTRIPYPKAGTQNSAVRVGVISADGGQTRWMQTPGDPRNNYIVSLDWTNDSNAIVLQHLNRLQNTLQVLAADPKTGATRTILTEKDEAWVDVTMPEMRWLDSGRSFLWVSERDGWRHAYTVSLDGANVKPLTPGAFDVINIQAVDEPAGWLYYIASPGDATQRYLFRARLDGGGAPERITPESNKGWNTYNISPNNRWAIQVSSAFSTPPKVYLLNLANKSVVRTMVENAGLRAKLDRLKKGSHEFFRVEIGDGVTLDGWMMKPPDFDPAKKYPVLFHVYGEPAGVNVTDSWRFTYLWHLMLTQRGYIIASVDNRGTPAPRGRAWRKIIHRKTGVLSSREQADAVKAMTAKMPYMDASRVGIWGWSGGGFHTLHALFRYPELYRMGMAIAPGIDGRYYDTIYTERYMGLPQDNPEVYKQSSPTTFVNGLKGDLLIVHGTGDDNVHYQGTEYLMNALIAANKQFTIMPYPNRSHGISEGEGTTRHLYELLTQYLTEHLPAGQSATVAGRPLR
ncbi:MAG TPA: S9 family peptidase [Pyrinomonadaceae bacterium]